jgi:hypothetical protein
MIFELRQYRCQPGQREAFVRAMEEEVIPFQVKHGMVILGSFIAEEDDNAYVWIRRFKDDAEREAQYAAVYQSDHWKNVIAPLLGPMMDREGIKVTRLLATPRSPIQ